MRTILRTTIKGNTYFYVKETIVALDKLLKEKGSWITVTKRRYNQKKILSERKILVKKLTILMVDRVE